VAPSKSFQTVRDPAQLIQMLAQIDTDASHKMDQELSAQGETIASTGH
jgi:predicted DNA-binding ArsR family transcriptional regulator